MRDVINIWKPVRILWVAARQGPCTWNEHDCECTEDISASSGKLSAFLSPCIFHPE